MLVLLVWRFHFEQQMPRWNYNSGENGGKGTESRDQGTIVKEHDEKLDEGDGERQGY